MKFKNKEIQELSKKDLAKGLNDEEWNEYFILMSPFNSDVTLEEKIHLSYILEDYESEIKNY
ncbi:hypothetical protein CHPC974_001256 [Lactococcus phage CHPC974]|nr:hypothetical protein CHPC974_001256 [Lactococcus phage CHPC974]